MRLYNFLSESKTLNVANVPLDKAREYAESIFSSSGKSLDKVLPNFDKNYMLLQNKTKKALDIPRIKMPVIEPTDMKEFHEKLIKGSIDVFKPYARGAESFLSGHWKPMTKDSGAEWIRLGLRDGEKRDDVVRALWTKIQCDKLLPLQSQIWLEKLIKNIDKFGVPKSGSPVLSTTIIVSSEGYILDGHHRFGQVMLADPSLKMNSLRIPLEIDMLLKVTRTYGAAIGNKPKA